MSQENDIQQRQSLTPGTILCGGKYHIAKQIGAGGFGITYIAIQSGLNRKVCIKEFFLAGKCVRNTSNNTIAIQGTSQETFDKYRQAFVKEAKTVAALHHNNIVEVIDVFDENDTSYMVMPFIEGQSLQSIVSKSGRLDVPEAINYIAQISNAIGYVHQQHILHRDIKPDNIMITPDAKAILIDFGSAREFEQDKTQAHTSMLTHGYAPTEQYTKNSRKGAYTDIYAIGATLYFILTGEVPTEAAARLTETMPEPQELNPEIPEEVNRTILKAMQIKSENRHQNIQEFMDDLLNVKPSVLIDESIGGTIPPRRNILWWLLPTIAVAVTGIIVTIAVISSGSQAIVPAVETYDFTGEDLYPMVKVDGGWFTMGSYNDSDCQPHNIYLNDFYIGQFEVTQGLWRKVMGDNPSDYQPDEDEFDNVFTQEQRDSLPVENVSYDEVLTFINRLNNMTGANFSLPTEAQWEYAARGGQKSHGYDYAGKEIANNEIIFGREYPVNVKYALSKNELGLYHMSGNVAEWCLDFYDSDFYATTEGWSNPVNSDDPDATMRVYRGGSFDDEGKEYVSVYYRNAESSYESRADIGFRLVVNNESLLIN